MKLKENVREMNEIEVQIIEKALDIYQQEREAKAMERLEEMSNQQAIALVSKKIVSPNCIIYPCDLGIGRVGLIVEIRSEEIEKVAI